MRRIKAIDLIEWSSRIECRDTLPHLIRKLIRATNTNILHIHFPTGESTVNRGYDGVLNVSKGTEYIPEGCSVWEIGCSENIKSKANQDYDKRKDDPLDKNPSQTTFVFVTPRKWQDKNEWLQKKKMEGFWKDVIVYDADNLEDWLEQATGVSFWFGNKHLSIPMGIRRLEEWWDNWRNDTNPPLSNGLVLAGREDEALEVQKWLNEYPATIMIQASTIKESIAFLAALINSLPENERELYFSKTLVIKNYDDFLYICTTSRNELILILEFEEIEGLHPARKNGHNVYVPLVPESKIKNAIILPRLEREAFISELIKMGLDEETAKTYSRDVGRDINVLRRKLSFLTKKPEWSQDKSFEDFIPALLVGKWIESHRSDETIISKLAETPYSLFSRKIQLLKEKSDSPIIKVGDSWMLKSHEDSWFTYARYLTRKDMENFKEAFFEVFNSLDPALELNADERWKSVVCGKIPKYSEDLRQGIGHTLILIAIYGDEIEISLPITAQSWVDGVLHKLLKNASCNLWNSISDVLSLFSEASPSAFLDAVESSLSEDEKPIMKMFSETDPSLFSSSNHPKLLWALESLAWSSELLPRITLILGKLATLDPGGKLNNRPLNSLREIFLLWKPSTYANFETRFSIIDTLLNRQPEIGWDLLINLMPKNHDISHGTSKTLWREFSDEEVKITLNEHLNGINNIINRLILFVGDNGQKWVEIMDNYSELPPDERLEIIKNLSSRKISSGHLEVRDTLRSILSQHRSYPDAEWSLPEEELEKIEKIYVALTPQNIIDQHLWLFEEHWLQIPEGIKEGNRHDKEAVFDMWRFNALKEIYNELNFEGLMKLALQTKNPDIIGYTFAKEEISSELENKVLSLLESRNENKISLVKAYIFRKAFNQGEKWVKNLIEKSKSEKWSETKLLECFVSFPQRKYIWNILSEYSSEFQKEYWKNCLIAGIPKLSDDRTFIIQNLIHVKRYFAALDFAVLYAKDIPTELIAELLQKFATEESEDDGKIKDYRIGNLFKVLDESNIPKNDIAMLEWNYIQILANVGSNRPPKMLHAELAKNPDFFAEVIQYIYKAKNEDLDKDKVITENSKQKALFGWKLLKSWDIVPGTNEKGDIDYEKLRSWVNKVIELCEKSDRKEIGEQQIGNILAHAKNENEMWPPEAVCRIIDETQSDNLNKGFEIGIYNKRGAYSKSLDEGGKQELQIAKKYDNYSANWIIHYPKTASILKKVSENYINDAKREDEEAEKLDLEH